MNGYGLFGHWADDEREDECEDGSYGYRSRSQYAPHDITCFRCGAHPLRWANDGRSWYLVDADTYEPHICPDHQPASPDEFEDLS